MRRTQNDDERALAFSGIVPSVPEVTLIQTLKNPILPRVTKITNVFRIITHRKYTSTSCSLETEYILAETT